MTKFNEFKNLKYNEKKSILQKVSKLRLPLIIWEKGQTEKYVVSLFYFDANSFEIFIKDFKEDILNKAVCFSFKFENVNYFGTTDLISLHNEQEAFFKPSGEIYKKERRRFFRLLSKNSGNKNNSIIKASFQIHGYSQKSNILNFKQTTSNTNLFKSFLKLINQIDDDKVNQELQKFNVLDISISGFSIEISSIDLEFFKEGDLISNIYLQFEKDKILITQAQIVYVSSLIEKNQAVYKVGLKFINLNENADYFISNHINNYLRDLHGEQFEDIIN